MQLNWRSFPFEAKGDDCGVGSATVEQLGDAPRLQNLINRGSRRFDLVLPTCISAPSISAYCISRVDLFKSSSKHTEIQRLTLRMRVLIQVTQLQQPLGRTPRTVPPTANPCCEDEEN